MSDKVNPRTGEKGTDGRLRAFRAKRRDYFTHGIDEYPLPVRALYTFALAVVYLFTLIRWRPRVEGLDAFVEHVRDHGSVIVMNHVSMCEPVVIVTALWRRGIRVRPLYKSEFDRIGPARFFFPRIGAISVVRGSADLTAIRACKDALLRGECVLVYPEGTRVKSDDQPVEIHGGFSMIAQMGKSDVVPMAVVGAADPYKTRPTRAKRPIIRIGAPVSFDSLAATGRKARMEEMERVAMERVYELRSELRDANPGLW